MAGVGGRIEDFRLLKGVGCFVADALPKVCLHAAFLRSAQASARLTRLDAAPARAMPGVVLVLTAADLAASGPVALPPEPVPGGDGAPLPGIPLLCGGEVRHLGEPLALIVAESRAAALDAAEAVELDLEDRPVNVGVAFRTQRGDAQTARAALAASTHRVTVEVYIPRISAVPLETRGAVAIPAGDGLVLHTSTQNPFAIRRALAALFGWPEQNLRVLAPDVGGSFGQKGVLSREEALVALAARRLGRPVAWVASRSEAFLADHQGRGVAGRLTLGLDAMLRFTAVEAEFEIDVGAYPGRGAFGLVHNAAGITGPYRIPVAAVEITGRLSARAPLAPYRGNGRPEATLAIERAVDAAARTLGANPVELRRRNLLEPAELPHRTALGFPLNCGNYPRVLEAAARGASPEARAARRREAEARGRLYGFGFALSLESAAGPVRGPRPDRARVTALADGRVRLAAGAMSTGQGHETALTRMAGATLGLPPECFDYVNGDTAATAEGRGIGGSSGLSVGGAAMQVALERFLDSARARAAVHLRAAPEELAYEAGVFAAHGSNLTRSLAEIAAAEGGSLSFEAEFRPEAATFPNGAHLCELEIDPETGAVAVTRSHAVVDVGRVLNPDLVEGQLMGGIAMGLAQALGEAMVHDAAGQVLSGSLMDYRLIRAEDAPRPELAFVEVPTALNPLGTKGVGEAGTVGALAAAMSALSDALASAGVETFQMPATPLRVWQALAAARGRG